MSTIALSFDDSSVSSPYVRALTSDRRWDSSQAITFHLAFSDTNGNAVNDWLENGAADAFRTATLAFTSVANITLTEVSSVGAANLVERIGDADGNLGQHGLPGVNGDPSLTDGAQSLGVFNPAVPSWQFASLQRGGFGYLTMLHELGHGLGLDHSHEDGGIFPGVSDAFDFGDNDLNQGLFTVMSYNDGYALAGGAPFDTYGWMGSLGVFDIAALQAIYGANMSEATGDNTYRIPDQNQRGTYYETIWDAGGIDTLAYDGFFDAVIMLGAATLENDAAGGGLLSYVPGTHGGILVANGVLIENGRGGSGADLIAGNMISNDLRGNGGDDVLVGLGGADRLDGNDGNDLLIGDSDFGLLETVNSDFSNGISLGAGSLVAGPSTDNGLVSTAIDVSTRFSLNATSDVLNATTVPHVRISGTGDGQFDIFSVEIKNEFAVLTADIDGASFDTTLAFADANGTILSFNDDAPVVQGAAGSTSSNDAFIRFAPSKPGTYYIAVAASDGANSSEGIAIGETYTLNLSVAYELEAGRYSAFIDELEAVISANDGVVS